MKEDKERIKDNLAQEESDLKKILGGGKIPAEVKKAHKRLRLLATNGGMVGPLTTGMLVTMVDNTGVEVKAAEKPEEAAEPDEDAALKPGDKVLVEFEGKECKGVFLHQAGGIEKGKVRVAIEGDSEKYREVPEEAVKRA